MSILDRIKSNLSLRRLIVILAVALAVFLLRDMISFILLTLIFTFLAYRFVEFLYAKTKLNRQLIVFIFYGIIIGFLYLAINHYVKELVAQTNYLSNTLIDFYQQPTNDNWILKWIADNLNQIDLKAQIESGLNVIVSYATNIGHVGISVFMAFVLSFFFMIEKNKVEQFSKKFLTSKFDWFFQELYDLGRKFINTFGVVLETQFIIAIFNTIFTITALYFLGFSQLLSLTIIVFILSLIPVAGVIISCIPLSIIAYSIGGLDKVIIVLLMIIIIHAFEAYFLNPRIMSSKTKLPVFYVFIVLILAQSLFGTWGLIIGIPIFVFVLDLLDVTTIEQNKSEKKIKDKAK